MSEIGVDLDGKLIELERETMLGLRIRLFLSTFPVF